MTINKFVTRNLLNAEFYQFLVSANAIFDSHKIDFDRLQPLYEALQSHAVQMEISLASERRNEKIRKKNEMDTRRDRLHGRLFNYLKYILFDETDERYNDAREVMNIVRTVGNPTQLSENRQSALMTTLGNRLRQANDKLEAIGAKEIVDQMMDANTQFIELERQVREITAAQKTEGMPSAGNARREAYEVYRTIVDAINAFAKMQHKKEKYADIVTDMNVLVNRYNTMMAARRRAGTTATAQTPQEDAVDNDETNI
jgi:hypothetical protein